MPILNKHLEAWKNAWIYHPLRSEKNKTPIQLWILGLHYTMQISSSDEVKSSKFIQTANLTAALKVTENLPPCTH